jgi:hypothetical protein
MAAEDRLGRSLGTLWKGLIGYGLVGLIIAIGALGATVVLTGRLDTVVEQVSTELTTAAATIDATATALDHASSTSASVGATIGQAGPALQKVSDALTGLSATLHEIETSASSVSILGQTPLTSLGQRFGALADQVDALQGQVAALHGNLADNQANLSAMGTSLSDVADQLRAVKVTLDSGQIEDGLSTTVEVIRWLMVLMAVLFAVPAVAALWFGVWLRRQLVEAAPAA